MKSAAQMKATKSVIILTYQKLQLGTPLIESHKVSSLQSARVASQKKRETVNWERFK